MKKLLLLLGLALASPAKSDWIYETAYDDFRGVETYHAATFKGGTSVFYSCLSNGMSAISINFGDYFPRAGTKTIDFKFDDAKPFPLTFERLGDSYWLYSDMRGFEKIKSKMVQSKRMRARAYYYGIKSVVDLDVTLNSSSSAISTVDEECKK